MADEKFTPPSDAVAETKFTPPTDAIADTQKKSPSVTTAGVKEPSGADLGTQQGQQPVSGEKGKYGYTWSGGDVGATQISTPSEQEQRRVVSYQPKELKAVNSRQALRSSSEELNKAGEKLSETNYDVSALYNNQIKQYSQLSSQYESEKDPNKKKELAKQLKELQDQPYVHFTFVPTIPPTKVYYDKDVAEVKTVADAINILNKKQKSLETELSQYETVKNKYKANLQEHVNNIDLTKPTGFIDAMVEAAKLNERMNQISDLAQSGYSKDAIKKLNETLYDYQAVTELYGSKKDKTEETSYPIIGTPTEFGESLYGLYNSLLRPIGVSATIGAAGSAVGTPATGVALADAYLVYDAYKATYAAELYNKYSEYKQKNMSDEEAFNKANEEAQYAATTSGLAMTGGIGATKLLGAGVQLGKLSKFSEMAFTQGVETFGSKEVSFIDKIVKNKALKNAMVPSTFKEVVAHAAKVDVPGFTTADLTIREARGEDVTLQQMEHTAALPILMNTVMFGIGKAGRAVTGGQKLWSTMSPEGKMDVLATIALQDQATIEPMIQMGVAKNVITKNQATELRKSIAEIRSVSDAIPSNVTPEVFKEVFPLVKLKQNMEQAVKDAEVEPPGLKAEIEKVDRRIQEVVGADLTTKELENFEKIKAKPAEQRTESDKILLGHYTRRQNNYKILSAERLTPEEGNRLNALETKQESNQKLSEPEKMELDYLKQRRAARLEYDSRIKETAKPEAVTEGKPKTKTDATKTIQQQEGVSAERKTGGEGGETREAGGGDSVQRKAEGAEEGQVSEGGVTAPTPEPVKVDKTSIVSNTKAEVDRVIASEPNENGDGQTFNLDGTVHSEGGLVIPIVSENLKVSELTPERIADFVEANKDKLGGNSVKVGIYKFPNGEDVSIDLNVVAPREMREQAIEFGREAGQESLWDLDIKKNIKTGSDGKNPKQFTAQEFIDIAKRFSETPTEPVAETTAAKTEVETAISNVAKALKETGVEIEQLSDQEFREITKDLDGQMSESEGLFIASDGKIYLNSDKLSSEWGKTIVFHEGTHPIINIIRNTNKATYDSIIGGLKKAAETNKGIKEAMDWAQKQYGSEGEARVEDEAIVETIARIGDGRLKLDDVPPSLRQKFIDTVNSIAKMLGFDQVLSDTDPVAFKKMAEKIATALREGQDISEIVGKENVKEYEARFGATPSELSKQSDFVDANGKRISNKNVQSRLGNDFSNLTTGMTFKYLKNTEEFEKLKSDGYITEDKNLKDFEDGYIVLHSPDGAFTGEIIKDGETLIEGSGGIFYPIKYHKDGYFWASTETGAASLARLYGYGQLGLSTSLNYFEPTQLGTDTWISVSAGYDYTLAVKSNGTLWAWGYNNKGQLGNGTLSDSNTPIQIGTATNWSKVYAGNGSSFALKTNGTLWAWGDNQYSQLGDGTITNRTTPVQIGTANDWQQLGVGGGHAVGKKTNGTIWAWGLNNYTQLGNGTNVSSSTPIQIGTATNWLSIDAGVSTTSAIKTDGTMYVWGRNNLGQLGDGTTSQRSAPIPINCPTTSLGLSDNVVLGSEIKVYPNPTNAMVTISGEQEIVALVVYNLLGQEVLTKSINATETTLDVSQLPKGTYMMKLKTVNTVQTLKVIKQ